MGLWRPKLDATLEIANAVSIPVIVSGGISSMADIQEIANVGSGKLEGCHIWQGGV